MLKAKFGVLLAQVVAIRSRKSRRWLIFALPIATAFCLILLLDSAQLLLPQFFGPTGARGGHGANSESRPSLHKSESYEYEVKWDLPLEEIEEGGGDGVEEVEAVGHIVEDMGNAETRVLPVRLEKLLTGDYRPQTETAKETLEAAKVMNGSRKNIMLWPVPLWYTQGERLLEVSRNLRFEMVGPASKSNILRTGTRRYRKIIFNRPPRRGSSRRVAMDSVAVVRVLVINVTSADEALDTHTTESYQLDIEADGSSRLKTLSQLSGYSLERKAVMVKGVPIRIKDRPRFAHRGLLLDSARHFWPVSIVKQVIASMAFCKLNVLHWHLTDWQSFPIEIPSLPLLWNAAWSSEERYSVEDLKEVVRGFAYPHLWPSLTCRTPLDVSKGETFDFIETVLRDMRDVFEYRVFHMGGDEVNLGKLDPHYAYLEPERDHKGCSQLYLPYMLLMSPAHPHAPPRQHREKCHVAGRVVGTQIVGRIRVTYNNVKVLNKNRIGISYRLGRGAQAAAYWLGYPSIMSAGLYLDYQTDTWQMFYQAASNIGKNLENHIPELLRSPLGAFLPIEDLRAKHNVTIRLGPDTDMGRSLAESKGKEEAEKKKEKEEEKKKKKGEAKARGEILGGEMCMWSEVVSPGNLFQTLFPRLAAGAEGLWSSNARTQEGAEVARERLAWFKCLLMMRGVESAPMDTDTIRTPPFGPGSCHGQ